MRIFDHFNGSGTDTCPICGTKDDKPTTLVTIKGTTEGNIAEAVQVHVDCIELVYDPKFSVVYQVFEKVEHEKIREKV